MSNNKKISVTFVLKMALLSLLIVIPMVIFFIITYKSKENSGGPKEVLYTSAKISDENFIDKIKSGRINEIAEALSLGANPKAVDNINRNAMMIAAIFNNKPDIVQLLVDYGVSINHQDVNGYNALMMSILSGGNSMGFSKELIKKGININAKTNSGISVLMVAAGSTNDVNIIEEILKSGADVNYKNAEGVSALMVAAKITTNPKVIELLLKYGANKNDKDILGISVYEIAKSNKALKDNLALLNRLK